MKLLGKSQKGKNRIRELGGDWELIEKREVVKFSSEKGWLLIMPKSNPEKIRWIRAHNDPDFEIVEM
jgi:hypothetical protein